MFKSLRMRLQFWYGLLLAVVITSFAIVLYIQQRRARFAEIDTRLVAAQQFLVGRLRAAPPETLAAMLAMAEPGEPAQLDGEPALGDPPDHEMPRPGRFRRRADRAAAERGAVRLMQELQVLRMFRHERPPERPTELPYFSLWRSDGMLVKRSAPHAPEAFPGLPSASPLPRGELRRRGPSGRPGNVRIVDRDGIREAVGPGPQGTIVLVGRRTDRELRELRALLLLLIGTGTGVFAVGLLGGWIVAGRAIEPIRHMTEVAREISGTNWSRRLEATDTDSELGQLAHTLNDTFDRLESAYDQQARFTSDASHELRTPLSVLQTHQELALSKPRTAEEYRQTLETCRRATERISSLVGALLTLARLDAAEPPPSRQRVEIAALVERCVAIAEPLAESKQIRIEARLEEASAAVDPLQIEQVITNLLSNAIHYSGPGSVVSVRCEASADQVCVTVADQGIGISEDDLPRIFNRFYRVDQARSRDAGGSGLGLAISQRIAQTHGGTLLAESELGRGSTFRLRLPRTDSS